MSNVIFSDKEWLLIDLIKYGQNYLQKNGFSNSRHEMEWLLCDLLNYNRSDLYNNSYEKISHIIFTALLNAFVLA